MLTNEEVKKMEEVFKRNKKLGVKPQTQAQLASILGISRQLFYHIAKTEVGSKYEAIVKNWIKENSGKKYKVVYKVCENKLKYLEKYGFQHDFKSYYTKYTTLDSGSYQYVVNETDCILKMIITNEDRVMIDLNAFELPSDDTMVVEYEEVKNVCIFDEKITDFDLIYNLTKDKIIYRTLEIE